MKTSKILLNALLIAMIGISQANAQKADPSVNGATVVPAPNTYPGGSASVSFNFLNLSSTGVALNAGNHINLTLSNIGLSTPFSAAANITGSGAVYFNFTYDAASLTLVATQKIAIPALAGGLINFGGLTVTGESLKTNPQNGLNVNVVFLGAFNSSTSNDNTSSFTFTTSGGSLPVTLTDFNYSVSNCGVNLKWTTSQEKDLKNYVVETSIDGANFTPIGTVTAKGNSSSISNYSLVHATPKQGTNYYRLVMTDKDGTKRYSSVLSVKVSCEKFPVRITPNPFIDRIGIHFTSGNNELVTIILLDNTGKQIQSKSVKAIQGDNNYDLNNLGVLPAGLYIVQVKTSSDVFTQQLVK